MIDFRRDPDYANGEESFPGYNHKSFVYLHGQIEQLAGHDIVDVNQPLENLEDGIYDCTYTHNDGSVHKCNLYMWLVDRFQKGLIVHVDDSEMNDDALKKYNKRAVSV